MLPTVSYDLSPPNSWHSPWNTKSIVVSVPHHYISKMIKYAILFNYCPVEGSPGICKCSTNCWQHSYNSFFPVCKTTCPGPTFTVSKKNPLNHGLLSLMLLSPNKTDENSLHLVKPVSNFCLFQQVSENLAEISKSFQSLEALLSS